MTTPKLKPCPFCGEKPSGPTWIEYLGEYEIACVNKRCLVSAIVTQTTIEHAYAVWNQRAK